MEWVLQVVDEVDDAVGALRHGCLKMSAEVSMWWDGTRALLAGRSATITQSPRHPPTPR